MLRAALLASLLPLSLAAASATLPAGAPAPAPAAGLLHCQVPCGIYGDKMRIDMLMEDATTVEKAMSEVRAMESGDKELVYNQLVRWISNKEEHAQRIQDQVAAYWLAQRIKAPADGAGEEATAKYHGQLALLHGVIVDAMKCKQTTDAANVKALRDKAMRFSETYFTGEDLEHLKSHHMGEER